MIAICTLNEAANVGEMIASLRSVLPTADLLVVDDSSPDGTADIATQLASTDPKIQVEVRTERGLGGAIRFAMLRAIEGSYDWFINLDGDFSHNPQDLPRMMTAALGTISLDNQPSQAEPSGAQQPDVVIGSRYAAGGAIIGWPIHRKWMSRLVNGFATRALRLPVSDCSGSMRCYRVSVLKRANVATLVSNGYSVLEEILVRLNRVDAKFVEVPITFSDRTAGQSKLTLRVALGACFQMVRLMLR